MTIGKLSILAGATALGLAGAAGPAVAEWQPVKPDELIIMAGPGGGADQIARLLQGLIQQKSLSPVPFISMNKESGSGAEALRYIQDKAGDDHTILFTLNSFYTTPIIQEGLGVDVTQFTPIGRLALDTFLLWVNADEENINSWEEYAVDYPVAPAVLAIVLGPLVENSFRQSMLASQGSPTVFFERPISLICILIAVPLFVYPIASRLMNRRRNAAA